MAKKTNNLAQVWNLIFLETQNLVQVFQGFLIWKRILILGFERKVSDNVIKSSTATGYWGQHYKHYRIAELLLATFSLSTRLIFRAANKMTNQLVRHLVISGGISGIWSWGCRAAVVAHTSNRHLGFFSLYILSVMCHWTAPSWMFNMFGFPWTSWFQTVKLLAK